MLVVSGETGDGGQDQIMPLQKLTGLDKMFEFHFMSNEKPFSEVK